MNAVAAGSFLENICWCEGFFRDVERDIRNVLRIVWEKNSRGINGNPNANIPRPAAGQLFSFSSVCVVGKATKNQAIIKSICLRRKKRRFPQECVKKFTFKGIHPEIICIICEIFIS